MTDKLNTYSHKYYIFIKHNIQINKKLNNDKMLGYYNTIKATKKYKIKKLDPIILLKLRASSDTYLIMDNLKKVNSTTLYKHMSPSIEKVKIDELLRHLDNNDKEKFAAWMILHHRIMPSLRAVMDIDAPNNEYRENIHTLLYDNPFVALNIQNYYETHNVLYTTYEQQGITLHLYEYSSMPSIDPGDVFHIIDIMRIMSKKKIKVKVVILGTPFKKKLVYKDDNDKTILPIHVNSGSTLRSSYINIWRYEEWQKVLIHEMIHYLEIDFNLYTRGFSELVKYLTEKFNVKGDIIPSEAYTELVAVIIHTMYISDSFETFRTFLMYEQNFSLFQAAKILDYISANSLDDIDKTINPQTHIILKQNSSILSYYILKASLLLNLEDIINFITSDIDFGNRMSEFINLVKASLSSPLFKSSIKAYIHFIKKTKEAENHLYSTMRMTCLQIY